MVVLTSKARGGQEGYIAQRFTGKVKHIDDTYVILEDVTVENLGKEFKFELNEIGIELRILDDDSLNLLK